MKTLVFLEDHEGKLQKDSLGVLSKAASLDGEVEAVLLGSEVENLLVAPLLQVPDVNLVAVLAAQQLLQRRGSVRVLLLRRRKLGLQLVDT